MLIAQITLPWWGWALFSVGAWGLRGVAKSKASEHGGDIATVLAFLAAAIACLAAVIALVVYCRWAVASSSLWLLPAAGRAAVGRGAGLCI